MLLRIASVLCLSTIAIAAPQAAAPTVKKAESFKPFTGKLRANKVRLRAKSDLESPIVRQMNKGELLLVVGEEGDFYAVAPLKDAKAYVFRSYILDNVVEANRVNVRLEPHVDAPIIGQLQAGDKVNGTVCAMNHKWLEIAPPKGTQFYVAKEFVDHAGGPEYLATMERRKLQVEDLLAKAFFNAEAECKKDFEEMSPQLPTEQFQTIVQNFSEFPEAVRQAKEGLALLKETYLNKKISFLEEKAELSLTAKQELLAKHKAENTEMFGTEKPKCDPMLWNRKNQSQETLSFWDTVEESLYLSWAAFHTGKTFDDYYAEQKANASVLTGSIESYSHDIKNRPGDYVLRGSQGAPIAYLYSTQVPLSDHVGKTITLLAAPRPNHHFAFPAYFVFSIE